MWGSGYGGYSGPRKTVGQGKGMVVGGGSGEGGRGWWWEGDGGGVEQRVVGKQREGVVMRAGAVRVGVQQSAGRRMGKQRVGRGRGGQGRGRRWVSRTEGGAGWE